LLVGIVIRSRINVETGSGVIAVPPEMTDVSIKINPPEPPSSSMRNTNFIPGSSPSAGLIKIPNPQVNFSAVDIDMRTAHPPLPITSDVLNTLDIGDLQVVDCEGLVGNFLLKTFVDIYRKSSKQSRTKTTTAV
jgi:hypothetical protein